MTIAVEIFPFGPPQETLWRHFPLQGVFRHRLKAPDHEDYRLVELSRPVSLDGTLIRFVVLWPCSGSLAQHPANLPFTVGLDLVFDESLVEQEFMIFDKCEPVGFAQAIIVDALAASA
ncbi:MAG TPA: hypothetical protein VF267_03785 [Gammaproteobacteria bacterium]